MKILIILLNKIIYCIGRCVKKGSSLPGKIALKLDKNNNGSNQIAKIIMNAIKKGV